jgi:hypothetical protein
MALLEKKAELENVENQLKALPVRGILPFEFPMLVKEGLRRAKQRIIITTTRPSERRTDPETMALIRAAANQSVHVVILIADKKAAVDLEGTYELRDPLLELGKIVSGFKNVQVGFLMDHRRPLYEIVCDETFLAASNDSPLGRRPREKIFTPFAGVLLSSERDVRIYVEMFLKDWETLASQSSIRIPPQRSRSRTPTAH